jgi:uncharacterized protein YbjT (DUF2867 family)
MDATWKRLTDSIRGKPLTLTLLGRKLVVPEAARGVARFVYVSVAHPAPVMQVYWRVRAECEELVRGLSIDATILRPWYVLGPGHRWPILLKPVYAVLERIPSTSESARRLGLVTLPQMIGALVDAAERMPAGVRVVEVEEIRRSRLQ